MAKNTKRRGKVNLPVVMAIVLFYLTVFSTYLTGGLYAKYMTTGQGGDSARVIKFGDIILRESGVFGADGGTQVVSRGVNMDMNVTVSFDGSEADTFIYVMVHTPGWTKQKDNITFTAVNGYMSWMADSTNWTYLKTEADADGKQNMHVYYKKLESNQIMNNVDFIRPDDAGEITVSPSIRKSDLPLINGLQINLKAYAVQANGFMTEATEKDCALLAWTSMSASF